MPGRAARWWLAALCVQFVALGLVQAWRDSPTTDESYDLATGLTALTRHSLRLTPEHPPLASILAALPSLAAHPAIPSGASWRSGDSDAFRADFMRAQAHSGKLQRVMFLARLAPLAEGIGVGVLCYGLAASLFGPAAGALAATTWLTLPLALGFAHIDGADMPFAAATLLVSLTLLRYAQRPTTRAATIIGLICGVALVVRLTALVLIPAAVAVVLLLGGSRVLRRVSHAFVIAFTSCTVVWVVYRLVAPFSNFHVVPRLSGSAPLWARLALLVPWPREYRYGIRKQTLIAKAPKPGYLLGHALHGGRWWFWPASMLVKLPASTLIVIVLGLVFWRGLGRRTMAEGALVLGVPAVALIAFTIPQNPLGLRYLLPVIALAIVAGSPLVRIVHRTVAARFAVGLVVFAQLFWFWESTPHSLAWTAPPFRPGYQVAADSNLDWGQDLYRLRDWSRRHPGTAVLYFGPIDPALVLHKSRSVGFTIFGGATPLPSGWWAVSATLLDLQIGSNKGLAWLRAYCPVGVVGASILLYRFQSPPNQLLAGPDKPAAVCHTSFTHVKATLRASSPQAASARSQRERPRATQT